MPTFNHDVSALGLDSKKDSVKIFQEPGIKAFDATHGSKDIKVPNRRIVVTTLKKSLRFDVNVSCFDINARY